jgi:hypothetical protein
MTRRAPLLFMLVVLLLPYDKHRAVRELHDPIRATADQALVQG